MQPPCNVTLAQDSGTKTLIIDSAGMTQVLSTPQHINQYQQATMECGVSIKHMQQWFDENKVDFTPINGVVLTEVFMTGVCGNNLLW